ncbi:MULTISPECIES: hypothetical protein [unclassified Microcoleus]|nr:MULTISPECIES: hypothetical protein [unclassified Microcoleus]
MMLKYAVCMAGAGISTTYTVMSAVELTGNCRSHSVNQISS